MLALELQELNEADFDLSLTGFDPKELDDLLVAPKDDEKANAVPPLPENPVFRPGDLWICGDRRNQHPVLCADATSPDAVARLLGERKPQLTVTDPPYGIELDAEWRDRLGLNGCGPAEASYMNHRTEGHTVTTISGETLRSQELGLLPFASVQPGKAHLAISWIEAFDPRKTALIKHPAVLGTVRRRDKIFFPRNSRPVLIL